MGPRLRLHDQNQTPGTEHSGSIAWTSAAALRSSIGPMKSPEMVRINGHRHVIRPPVLCRPLGKNLETTTEQLGHGKVTQADLCSHNGQGRCFTQMSCPEAFWSLHGQSLPPPGYESHHPGSAAALRLRPRVVSFLQGKMGREARVLERAESMIALSVTLWSKRFAIAKGGVYRALSRNTFLSRATVSRYYDGMGTLSCEGCRLCISPLSNRAGKAHQKQKQ